MYIYVYTHYVSTCIDKSNQISLYLYRSDTYKKALKSGIINLKHTSTHHDTLQYDIRKHALTSVQT